MMSHVSSLSTKETLWQPGCDVPEGSMAMGAVLQCGMNLGSLCDTPRQVLPCNLGMSAKQLVSAADLSFAAGVMIY